MGGGSGSCNDFTQDSKLPKTNKKPEECFRISTLTHLIILKLKPTYSLNCTFTLLTNLRTSLQQTFRNVTYKILWIWFPPWKKISRETGEKGGRSAVFHTLEEKLRSLVLTEDNQSAIATYLGNNPHWIKAEEVLFVCLFLTDYITEE